MNKYTIPCSEEQTKKAFKLGAPIKRRSDNYDLSNRYFRLKLHLGKYGGTRYYYVEIPTTEQMLGWLRSQGFRFKIEELSDTIVAYRATFGYWYKCGQSSNPKGATHAVIDDALGFLSKIKK